MASHLTAMIAGSQKAGTTALLDYLRQVDAVHCQQSFEFAYFADDRHHQQTTDMAIRKHFGDVGDKPLIAKSVGVSYLPWAAERLHEHNANCKIVVCVRNPTARAYSAYWFMRQRQQEPLATFEQALEAEAGRLDDDFRNNHHLAYVDRGRYVDQLDAMAAKFGAGNVHVVESSKLRSDPHGTIAGVLRFLDIKQVMLELDPLTSNALEMGRSGKVTQLATSTIAGSRFDVSNPKLRAFARKAKRQLSKLNRDATFETPEMAATTKAHLNGVFARTNQRLADDYNVDTSGWS